MLLRMSDQNVIGDDDVPGDVLKRLGEPGKCGIFQTLGNIITSDARYTLSVKSRIAMAKAEFSRKKIIFVSKLDLNLRKKIVKCYIWSIGLHGA
jgi:hypothetical protein